MFLCNMTNYKLITQHTIMLFPVERMRVILLSLERQSRREGTLGYLLYRSPKFYNTFFLFVDSITLGTFDDFWLVVFLSVSVQLFPQIVIYWLSNLEYHHYGCISIYQPLPYPFESLNIILFPSNLQRTITIFNNVLL